MGIEIKKFAKDGTVFLAVMRNGKQVSLEMVHPPNLVNLLLHPGETFTQKVDRKMAHLQRRWEQVDKIRTRYEKLAKKAAGA